jgi:hypothetical protein
MPGSLPEVQLTLIYVHTSPVAVSDPSDNCGA